MKKKTAVYKAPPCGNEISCVLHGVSAVHMRDTAFLRKAFFEALGKENFTILDTLEHTFSPQGYTLTALLAESHASIHTYPEYGSLFFYLYSCRGPDDGAVAFDFFCQQIEPSNTDCHTRRVFVENEEHS